MESVFWYMIKNLVLLGLFLGCYQFWLWRRKQFGYNRFFLLVGLIVAFVLPLVSLKKTVMIPWRPPANATYETLTTSENIAAGFNWELFFGVLFIGVSFFVFLWMLLKLKAVYHILRQATIIEGEKPRLLVSALAKTPFSFIRTIVFPEKQYKGPHYAVILAHEKVHIKQLHSIDVLLLHGLLVIGWWNPLLWLYKRAVIENLEFLADAATVSLTKEAKAYQYILLEQTVPLAQLSLVHPFYHSFLKKRIMMLNNNSPKKNPVASLLILPLLLCFLILFNTKTVAQMAPQPPVAPEIVAPETPIAPQTPDKVTTKISISVTIEASSTDEELNEGYVKLFEKYGIKLVFKKIKRTTQGLITGLNASFNAKEGKSGNYAVSGTAPIAPFEFYINLDSEEKITQVGFRGKAEKTASHLKAWAGNKMKDSLKITLSALLEEEEVLDTEEKVAFLVSRAREMKEEAEAIKEEIQEKKLAKKNMKMTINKLIVTDKDGKRVVYADDQADIKALVIVDGEIAGNDSLSFEYENIKDIDFDLVRPDSIVNTLGGMKAGKNGVFVIKTKKDPKEASKITLKKNSTKNWEEGEEKPLIVIDGKVQATGFDMKAIEVNNIESINVIKGAAAKKKYGEKAENGVIEIKLKKKKE